MTAFYNEIDPKAAAWLRELIAGGHIAPGVVDERDIRDIRPEELAGFTQCHFFAGIGGWSLALRLAGWPDDRPVWTGSCPCQPFSAAGKRAGVADERHLWPFWHWHIEQCRPEAIFGEQVASKDGLGWLDLVCADLEGTGYAVRAEDRCAAGSGAPHIRQRLWFGAGRVDHAAGTRHVGPVGGAEGDPRDETRLRLSGAGRATGGLDHPGGIGWQRGRAGEPGRRAALAATERPSDAGGVADASGERLRGRSGERAGAAGALEGAARQRERGWPDDGGGGATGGLADADGWEPRHGDVQPGGQHGLQPQGGGTGGLEHDPGDGRLQGWAGPDGRGAASRRCAGGLADRDNAGLEGWGQPGREDAGDARVAGQAGQQWPGATDGFWRDADWLLCRDGRWRPVEPLDERMAYGVSIGLDARLFEVVDAQTRQRIAAEALRAMREGYDAASIWGSVGGRFGFPAASVLLAVLCEQSGQLGRFQHRWPSSSEKGRIAEFLRALWFVHGPLAGTPPGRGFSEQLARELADALPKLSRKSPPHWKALALLTAGPLAQGVTDRVGLLRGYGNAIVPQVAAQFIRDWEAEAAFS